MDARTPKDVGTYYDQEVGMAQATGAGLIWFLGQDHLSPALSNNDEHALKSENWPKASRERVLGLADKMNIKIGQLVLDLGCGIGGPGRDICAATGAKVTGLSISWRQLINLRRLSRKVGSPYVDVVRADMQKLPFENNIFDHAFSINAVYHVGDAKAVINESHRVLKKDGHFGVDDWFVTSNVSNLELKTLRSNWSTETNGFHDFDTFTDHMREIGFAVEEIADFTEEAGEFLSEERFGVTFDEQVAPVLLDVFPKLYMYPGYQDSHRYMAVGQLRSDVLYMGELYRKGSAVYRQVISLK